MTSALEGVGGQLHAPGAFTPAKDPVPIVGVTNTVSVNIRNYNQLLFALRNTLKMMHFNVFLNVNERYVSNVI
jgi:hypothetical protein